MSFPQLFQDGSRNDWQDAVYDCDITIDRGVAFIEHKLKNAAGLEQLVQDGKAKWSLEVRCPRTLFSTAHMSREPTIMLRWDPSDVYEEITIFPGMIAVQELELPRQELTKVWQEANTVLVPAGWQLVRGITYSSQADSSSLLTFQKDETLDEGQMMIQENTSSGSLKFIVQLAPDIYENISKNRTLQVAALIGALGRLHNQPYEEPNEAYLGLKYIFEQHGFTPWDESDFDPAYTATRWERFTPIILDD